jgi:hypothetical protein
MKVERFFHIREAYDQPKGGATVLVTGDTEHIGQVDIQYVKVSSKDIYNKKLGRELARKAPIKVVALRYLPKELGRIQEKTCKYGLAEFNYAIPYFLPKE